jgi:hypothetical protein
LLITLGLIWGGGQGVYTALSNRQPTALTYQEYLRTKPKATWLELHDCFLSLPQASARQSKLNKEIKEVFIPIVSAPGQKDDQIHVLVATKDNATLELLEKLTNTVDEAGLRKLLSNNIDMVFPERTVKGLVRFGIDLNDRDRRKLADLDQNLASDFIIIDEGKQPTLAFSAVMLLIGLALAAWGLLTSGKRQQPKPPPLPQA